MNHDHSDASFTLDARLATDTLVVTDLPLSCVLLMNDARFPWLMLVPRRAGLIEITDLPATDQVTLLHEVNIAAAAVRGIAGECDKINIGALGNIVRQLHVHVVARRCGDAAWPAPVWGHGSRQPYSAAVAEHHCQQLRDLIGRHHRTK